MAKAEAFRPLTVAERRAASLAAQLDEARETIRQLRDALVDTDAVRPDWGLSPDETTVMGMMLARRIATREALYTVLYSHRPGNPPGERTLDTIICHMRRKLRAAGITIKTCSKIGWYLPPDVRSHLRSEGVGPRRAHG